MPLTPYQRGQTWWAKGRIEYDGLPITEYRRSSTGASSEAGAKEWIRAETERAIRRHLLGEDADQLTFREAVYLYPAKPAEISFIAKILPHLGDRDVVTISPSEVRELAQVIYPHASTDTWRRQVITPISAVINTAHDKGKCPPIKIRGFNEQQRIEQDERRKKQSRKEKRAASREWIAAFVAHADPYNAALVEFMFETAARVGQAVALTPSDLDLQNARVLMPASKGHARQWVAISMGMVVRLANLPPKRPHNRKEGYKMPPRVFGYADKGGMRKAWDSICTRAGIARLTPHEAGRHGFYTELRVRQGLNPHEVATAGRWTTPAVPERIYAHSEVDQADLRERIRTGRGHDGISKSLKPMGRKT